MLVTVENSVGQRRTSAGSMRGSSWPDALQKGANVEMNAEHRLASGNKVPRVRSKAASLHHNETAAASQSARATVRGSLIIPDRAPD